MTSADTRCVFSSLCFSVSFTCQPTISLYTYRCGPGQRRSYSDLQQPRRSGDRIAGVARYSSPVHAGPEVHPASHKIGTGSLSRALSSRGVALITHPYILPILEKEWCYTSTPPSGPFHYSYTSGYSFMCQQCSCVATVQLCSYRHAKHG